MAGLEKSTYRERTVHEMMDFDAWRQRHEEMVREAEQDRLAKVLRAGRTTRAGRMFLLGWELRRMVGVLRKFAKATNKPKKGAGS